jgi:hypothetical protein
VSVLNPPPRSRPSGLNCSLGVQTDLKIASRSTRHAGPATDFAKWLNVARDHPPAAVEGAPYSVYARPLTARAAMGGDGGDETAD